MSIPVKTIGLIGYPLTHSFSHRYFLEKFEKEQIYNFDFLNFQMENIDDLPQLVKNTPTLIGFNVTIPHKEKILRFLDTITDDAADIGAVNAVKVERHADKILLHGFNTDAHGFGESLRLHLNENIRSALILGTGGAAKAVHFALKQMGIISFYVSRENVNKYSNCLTYDQLNRNFIKNNLLIVNATPLGMYPEIEKFPKIPYQHLTDKHLLYDLIYNPATTRFLQFGKERGASIINGYNMLVQQAEEAWSIFVSPQKYHQHD